MCLLYISVQCVIWKGVISSVVPGLIYNYQYITLLKRLNLAGIACMLNHFLSKTIYCIKCLSQFRTQRTMSIHFIANESGHCRSFQESHESWCLRIEYMYKFDTSENGIFNCRFQYFQAPVADWGDGVHISTQKVNPRRCKWTMHCKALLLYPRLNPSFKLAW